MEQSKDRKDYNKRLGEEDDFLRNSQHWIMKPIKQMYCISVKKS